MLQSILKNSLASVLRLSRVPLSGLVATRRMAVKLTHQPQFSFAKINKKDKDKQKLDEEKKKAREEVGDASMFDLNPFEQKYLGVIENLKQTISLYRIGRLDPSMFTNIYVKVGSNSMPLSQVAEIAPKSANSCIFNAFDQGNLEAIQKAIQMADMGLQISRIDKTIEVVQLPNSMKEIKEKMIEKLKKNHENFKQKMGRIRNDGRDELKKYKKIIPDQRYKIIEKELTSLYEKKLAQLENVIKDKEKQLRK